MRQNCSVRIAHPPEAENDGMLEYWNSGFGDDPMLDLIIGLFFRVECVDD